MEETCWSKLSSELIKIQSKISFVLVVSEASPVDTSVRVLELKSKWHEIIILELVKKQNSVQNLLFRCPLRKNMW